MAFDAGGLIVGLARTEAPLLRGHKPKSHVLALVDIARWLNGFMMSYSKLSQAVDVL
jgi:hypothetical protein